MISSLYHSVLPHPSITPRRSVWKVTVNVPWQAPAWAWLNGRIQGLSGQLRMPQELHHLSKSESESTLAHFTLPSFARAPVWVRVAELRHWRPVWHSPPSWWLVHLGPAGLWKLKPGVSPLVFLARLKKKKVVGGGGLLDFAEIVLMHQCCTSADGGRSVWPRSSNVANDSDSLFYVGRLVLELLAICRVVRLGALPPGPCLWMPSVASDPPVTWWSFSPQVGTPGLTRQRASRPKEHGLGQWPEVTGRGAPMLGMGWRLRCKFIYSLPWKEINVKVPLPHWRWLVSPEIIMGPVTSSLSIKKGSEKKKGSKIRIVVHFL